MPTTKNPVSPRKPLNLPTTIISEVDRIIEKYEFYGNRQSFIESAIKEKIEKVRLTEAKLPREAEKHP